MFFIDLFKGMDVDLLPLLREARIPNTIVQQPNYSYLPESTLKNLLCHLGKRLSSGQFGIRVWEMASLEYVPYYLSKLPVNTTVHEALSKFGQLLEMESSNTKVYIKKAGGAWWFVREKTGADEVWFQYAELFSVTFMTQLVHQLTAGKFHPNEIGVQSSSVDAFKLLPQLQNVVFYNERPVTAIKIPDSVMIQMTSFNVPKSEPSQPLPRLGQFAQSLKLALKPYFTAGKLPLDMASEVINIHSRTIQRRLKEEGTNYKAFSEQILFELIKTELTSSTTTIAMIAQQFGYSDSAHFTRAFKRYVGVTPSQYRSNVSMQK
ncbi:helix-turn-helix domain-containing protein [Vibrio barjaei]|uniref:helix-turn-helix domain-containing protein n=1 Tax=Vibrio barjaei TaxID=1676683 RepID=UPI001428B811|nr:helix-turn-helix transcriptional regulator [Vibrio barjaei]